MIHADIPANEPISAEALANWARAMSHIAAHYRIACSPGALQASAPWFKDKAMPQALTQLARQAGLSFQPLTPTGQSLSRWRLPVVIQLQDGELVLVEQFDGDNQLDVCFVNGDLQRNRLALSELLPTIRFIIALRPLSAVKDSRVDAYVSRFRPDWLKSLVLKDLRPYGPVMLAALLINILSLSGIVFSMQVYDRVIPAQSWPSLYVLAVGVLIAMLFGFLLRLARGHVMDLLGKRADMRVPIACSATRCACATARSPVRPAALFLNCASWNRSVKWSPPLPFPRSSICPSSFCLLWFWRSSPRHWHGSPRWRRY